MATYNNGSITATVTPPTNYTGDYTYELQENVNGIWGTVTAANKGYNSTLFINPVTTNSLSHTFGNPGGFDENVEGSGTWVGLHPGNYKIVVTTTNGLQCEVEGTDTVGQGDPGDVCYGFNITAAVDGDTQITVTVVGGTAPFTWTLNGNATTPTDNQDGTFTFSGLVAGTQYAIDVTDNNQCTDTANATTSGGSLTPFECGDTTITIATGTEGATIPTSAVSATNGVTNVTAVYQDGTQVDAVYSSSSQPVDVVFVVPAGYSNSGNSITCDVTAPAGNPSTLCDDFNANPPVVTPTNEVNGADGEILVNVSAGTGPIILQLFDSNNNLVDDFNLPNIGNYTFQNLSSGDYTVRVTDNNGCEFETTVTIAGSSLTPFDCGDTTITIDNGTEGDSIPTSAVTASGVTTITAVYETGTTTPATYINGTIQVDVLFEIPAGYSNTGSITCGPFDAVGTSGGGGGTPANVYLLHGGNGGNQEFPISPDIITDSDGYTIDLNDPNGATLGEAMAHIIENQGAANIPTLTAYEISAINTTTLPNGITFPATSQNADAAFYIIVNKDNISLDLSTAQAFADPSNNVAVNFTSFLEFTYNNSTWRIYNTGANPGPGTQSYICLID